MLVAAQSSDNIVLTFGFLWMYGAAALDRTQMRSRRRIPDFLYYDSKRRANAGRDF